VFIEAKDDGSGMTTGAIGRAKLQSNHHHQQTYEHTGQLLIVDSHPWLASKETAWLILSKLNL